MKGFIRRQEENMTIRFLIWKYEKMGLPIPSDSDLEIQANAIVDDAHRIARERGKNVMAIIKELVGNVKKQ